MRALNFWITFASVIAFALPARAQVALDNASQSTVRAVTQTIAHSPTARSKRPEISRAVLASLAVEYADHLFADGDYYRAIGEYRRYLYLTQGRGDQALRAAMAIGEVYLRSRKLDAAAAQFESVAARVSDSQIRAVALLSAGRAHLLNDKLLLAAARLAEARTAVSTSGPVAHEALYLLAWARLLQEDWATAHSAFAEIAQGDSPHAPSAAAIVAQLELRGDLDQKNPLIAMGLSLIPGLGHVYLGQWAVGAAALTWNALFIFGTGWSIYTGEYGVAAVLGVFELSWFSGTMFGALNGAMRYNRDVATNWLDEIVGAHGRGREIPAIAEATGHPGDLHRLMAMPR